MSEEAPKPESLPGTDISPLRTLLTEMHEVYQELRYVGFTDTVATSIVGQMLSDAMLFRGEDAPFSDGFDSNDEDDESDENNERGLE